MIDEFEDQLRAAAPTLPPALRTRTLARCSAESAAHRRRARQKQLRWVWALTGIFALHWLIVAQLEAQNTALVHGNTGHGSPPPTNYAQLPEAISHRSAVFSALIENDQPLLNQQIGRNGLDKG